MCSWTPHLICYRSAFEQQNVTLTRFPCFAAEKTDVAVWKELLGKAQQCEQLSKGRKSMRKLMLQLYGGHSAYHDAKAHTRLTHAHKVCCHLMHTWSEVIVLRACY